MDPTETEPAPLSRIVVPTLSVLDRYFTLVEVVVAALLALTALWVLGDLVGFVGRNIGGPAVELARLALDRFLLVFIVVELFRIAKAYIEHVAVLHTVFEAGLVAVAREIVLFDFTKLGLPGAAALALLLAALIGGYVVLGRGETWKATPH
jgi:uncharacterized membrane protein (DUF373 family)